MIPCATFQRMRDFAQLAFRTSCPPRVMAMLVLNLGPPDAPNAMSSGNLMSRKSGVLAISYLSPMHG